MSAVRFPLIQKQLETKCAKCEKSDTCAYKKRLLAMAANAK